jgi:IS5 family transposase
VKLRQSYIRVGKKFLIKINRYNHAKQFKRKRKVLKKLKNRVGRVYREIIRYIELNNITLDTKIKELLNNIQKLLTQTKYSKNKIYSLNEPQVVCISKGKANKRYEFGNKSSFITTSKECFILYADAHQGNPYDGHTLEYMLQNTKESLKEITNKTIKYLFADKGYRGHNYKGDTQVILETKTNKKEYKELKRRSSIEAVFSHTKQHHRMNRNFLKGAKGDLANTIFAACGYNLKKIYNKFKEEYLKLLSFLFFLFFLKEKPQKAFVFNKTDG